jgi:hypothetical protein
MQINRITACRFRYPAENLMKPAWPRSVGARAGGALRQKSSGECGSECARDTDGLPWSRREQGCPADPEAGGAL